MFGIRTERMPRGWRSWVVDENRRPLRFKDRAAAEAEVARLNAHRRERGYGVPGYTVRPLVLLVAGQ